MVETAARDGQRAPGLDPDGIGRAEHTWYVDYLYWNIGVYLLTSV